MVWARRIKLSNIFRNVTAPGPEGAWIELFSLASEIDGIAGVPEANSCRVLNRCAGVNRL